MVLSAKVLQLRGNLFIRQQPVVTAWLSGARDSAFGYTLDV